MISDERDALFTAEPRNLIQQQRPGLTNVSISNQLLQARQVLPLCSGSDSHRESLLDTVLVGREVLIDKEGPPWVRSWHRQGSRDPIPDGWRVTRGRCSMSTGTR